MIHILVYIWSLIAPKLNSLILQQTYLKIKKNNRIEYTTFSSTSIYYIPAIYFLLSIYISLSLFHPAHMTNIIHFAHQTTNHKKHIHILKIYTTLISLVRPNTPYINIHHTTVPNTKKKKMREHSIWNPRVCACGCVCDVCMWWVRTRVCECAA